MGVLRDRMAVDLRLRGLSPVTQRMYLRCAERFVAYHRRSPTALGEAEIRSFLDHLVRATRVSRSTHGVYVAAIHFLYRVTLDSPAVVQRTPYPRRVIEQLPPPLRPLGRLCSSASRGSTSPAVRAAIARLSADGSSSRTRHARRRDASRRPTSTRPKRRRSERHSSP